MNSKFDLYAQKYQSIIDNSLGVFGQKHDFFVKEKVGVLIESFKEVGNIKKLNVLDVGCGIGLYHGGVSKAVNALYGVDVSQESLDIAILNNPEVSYETYDGIKLPFPDSMFDCVYAICVLHHVPKERWQKFISEMNRVVRPGGQLLVIEHNPINPATQWIVRSCELDDDAVLLLPWRLNQLFKRVGIEMLKVRYTLFTPFSHKFFRKVDNLLCRIPFGAQYLVKGRKSYEQKVKWGN